jgi:hypothetical protein
MSVWLTRKREGGGSETTTVGWEPMSTVILVGMLLAVGVVFFSAWLRGSLAIDACLDSGGCWNYSEQECELENQFKCDRSNP